jgi:hypothetical protein
MQEGSRPLLLERTCERGLPAARHTVQHQDHVGPDKTVSCAPSLLQERGRPC